MAFNPENRITWEELAPSLQELFKNLQSQITREVERARNEELRLDRKIDDEIARAKSEERRIETKLDKEIDRSTQEDEDIHEELDGIKDQIKEMSTPPEPGGDNMQWDGGSGWIKMPNGVIMQCGVIWVDSLGNVTHIPFKVSFTTACFGFWAMHMGSDPVGYCIYKISGTPTIDVSGCDVRAIGLYETGNGHGPGAGWPTFWFAIGI